MAVMERRVGGEAMRQLLNAPVADMTPAMYKLGLVESAGVDAVFGLPDQRALKILTEGHLYWVGNCLEIVAGDNPTAT